MFDLKNVQDREHTFLRSVEYLVHGILILVQSDCLWHGQYFGDIMINIEVLPLCVTDTCTSLAFFKFNFSVIPPHFVLLRRLGFSFTVNIRNIRHNPQIF